ncbi:MAG TPA: histidine phosphatase family protein [Candidatus Binataceae bacterium]|nr:histidine phosphatase family protein [Candidatus Binataceae bacterium]
MSISEPLRRSRLVLVRHGETLGNSSIRYYGRTDIALSDLGRRQMRAARDALVRRFGDGLEEPHFDLVFASPLSRAREGATVITRARPILIEEFVEINFGAFEGLTGDEIRDRYPEEFAHWMRNRLDPAYVYPKGESRAAFLERVHRGVARMLAVIDHARGSCFGDTEPARPIQPEAILVAHRGVIRAVIQRLANISPIIELASIHSLVRDRSRSDWQAELLDDTSHLASIK